MSDKEKIHDEIEAEYARLSAGQANPSMTPKEYRGLYGEVVTGDCYGLRALDFTPDVIVDIGANIGVFTQFARSLFPSAHIVAVEPDERNFQNILALVPHDDYVVFLKKALGVGRTWKIRNFPNGAHAAYLSETTVHSEEFFRTRPDRFSLSTVEPVMIDALRDKYASEGSTFVKIDCEGAESALFEHSASLRALAKVDGFAIEMHSINKRTVEALCLFSETHRLQMAPQTGVLHARKKP